MISGRGAAAVVLMLAGALGACGGGGKTIGLKSSSHAAASGADTSTTGAGTTPVPVSISAVSSGSMVIRPSPTTTAKASTSPTPAPSPTTAPAGQHTVVVTEADDQHTVSLHRGDRLIVELTNDSMWTEPASSNSAVLSRTGGSTSADGSAQATFSAVGTGQAQVTATGTAPPSPCRTAQPPCMIPQYARQYSVIVTVA